MKKNFFLTLMLAVLCTAASWAQFAPVPGKMYALKENTTGLYLDIQTLGINEPYANATTNNISLNAKPCIIYFEAGSNGKYKMKNVNGTYVAVGSRDWNAVIDANAYEWIITAEENSLNNLTIAKDANNYIGWDKNNIITSGTPIYNNAEGGNTAAVRLRFSLVEYPYVLAYTIKSPVDTYLNLELTSNEVNNTSTKTSHVADKKYFNIIPKGGKFLFNAKGSDYCIAYDVMTAKFEDGWSEINSWGAGISDGNKNAAWLISDFDNEGFARIYRLKEVWDNNAVVEKTLYLGADVNSADRGIYTDATIESAPWLFEGTIDYPTAATIVGDKYRFTSEKIYYSLRCNKIRFTLTESGGKFQNGKNRMSLDEFAIYDADGKKIELTVANVTGNNNKTYAGLFDGVNGTCGGTATWTDGTEDDWFEILLPNGVDLGGAFKFSFVTENTDMNAKSFTINTSYEKPADYTVVISAPQGQSVTVTYNGETINNDDKVSSVGFDKSLFDATDISGYTWSVIVNDENETVTIQYTAAQTVENPDAVVALIKRVGGESAAGKFKFVLDPSMNSKNEVFVIAGEDGKVLIKGSTISAITTGIGWYLNNYAHINIAWNSLNEKTVSGAAYADLSNIPVPTGTETRTCDAKYRYYLNYCTFGYSMTTWTWKRWQQEIDWMALHGVNMPLQIVGLEEVWRKFLTLEENGKRKYNYNDEEAKAFIPGPAFTAWWAMNNLEGWGGTAANGWGGVQDDAWYTRQANLAKQICARQRELGMEPVLPGFSGMVPGNFQEKTGVACNAGSWGGFARPKIVLPSNENFAQIAADYYACLEAVMGKSQYYSMDPFHEGGSISGGTKEQYEAAYKAIYNAMEDAKPGSQWLIQQWQWNHNNPNFQAYSINAVPAGRLIVLDLFSDGRPEFDHYNGYAPQETVFCAVPNFGGRSGLMGRLQSVTDNYFHYKGKYTNLKGIAAIPEAIEQTPIAYDLVYQLPWMGAKPDVAAWVKNYATARYGVENTELQAAWDLLRQGPLNYGADAIQGPVEDVWAARPNLDANAASTWGSTLSKKYGSNERPDATYTKERQQMLIEATYKLLAQNGVVSGDINVSNYNYDVVELGGAVMADYAHYLLLGIKEAKEAAGEAFANNAVYIARRDAFLQIIRDMDEFKGTNLNFRLGKWTQEARDAAAEANADADWYEFNNARTLITTWGDYDQSNGGDLRDYSYRSWQGMLKDYYLPRWEYYFKKGCTHPGGDAQNYFYFEWNWAHGMTHKVGDTSKSNTRLSSTNAGYSYTREPQGNTVEEANKMLANYIIPLKTDNGTVYAYRHLTNDIPAEYKVEGAAGGTIDFSKFFLANLDGATVTGDFINGTASDIKAVPVESDIAGNTYDAAITLTDGTVLNFKVLVNTTEMVAAKATLAALIEDMKELTAQVGTYKSVATEITLQSTTSGGDYYIWCNNPHTSGDDGAGGVAALLDEDAATYLHSNWSSLSSTHDYLQIDFGNAVGLDVFKIAGQQRNGGQNDRPKNIEIYGSNDNSTWTHITTVEGLPNTAGTTWESDVIYSAEKYSHLKFVVKTHDNYNQSPVTRPYFHMAKFDLFEVKTVADVFDEFNGTELTNEFAVEKYDVLLNAINVYKNATTADEINAATTALQTAYYELLAKVPFNGVYRILYKQNPVFIAYLEGNEYIAGANDGDYRLFDSNTDGIEEKYKGYYDAAMAGKVAADELFTIVSPGEGVYTLSAQGMYLKDTYAGWWGASAFSTDKEQAGVYMFEETTVNDLTEYRLKSTTSSWLEYVNDWGIVFGNNGPNDTYATFTLEKVTKYTLTVPTNGVATFCLPFNVVLPAGLVAYDVTAVGNDANGEKVYQTAQLAVAGEKIKAGTPVIVKGSAGEYTLRITIDNAGAKGALEGSLLCGNFVSTTLAVANVDKYTFTADAEFTLLTAQQKIAANSVWMEFDVTIETAIKEGVVVEPDTPEGSDATVTKPELGKVYRIKNYTVNTPDEYKYHYLVNSNVNIVFPTSVEGDDKSAMWVCTGADTDTHKYTFASALGTAAFGWQGVAEDALEYTISDGTIAGTVTLADGTTSLALTTEAWNNSGKAAFNQASNSAKAQAEYWSTDWYLEEVENPGVSYTASINKGNMWATMYLPYAVAKPEGVDVFYAVENAINNNVIELTSIAGTIPARTAVLLYRGENTAKAASFEFALAEDVAPVASNLFEGKIMQTAIDATGARVYLLVNYNAKEKFYWMAAEYNANCQLSNEGGYVKCDANKCYLRIEDNASPASSFSFRYEGTTGVEEVKAENGKVKAIYDLQGRKLTEITKPGFYIVDGEKVFVK